jgi:hypothetical protein
MIKRYFRIFTIVVFFVTVSVIGTLIFLPGGFFAEKDMVVGHTRVVIPQNVGSGGNPNEFLENQNIEESSAARVPFGENESVISIITRDFDLDSVEEQIIAYRNFQEIDMPIYVTYADTAENGEYARVWTSLTAATRPGSLVLYSEDLIGDGGVCALVSGMNGSGEQTLTVFRKNSSSHERQNMSHDPFTKIAEFIIEGSIAVQEVQRSQNYQQGGIRGQSLTISTFSRDYESANMLDQIETTYTYNAANGLYEQSKIVRVPGRQIEQRRVTELLSAPNKFEEFISGLWVHDLSNGQKQYVYFNPARAELVFYINNTEEVFTWQESNPTRYGLHIIGKNISLAKIRCTMNIELESLESIRLRVFQDAYLRTGPSTVWDGSYRKIQTVDTAAAVKRTRPYLNGAYSNESGGKIVFFRDGSYELYGQQNESLHKGKYVFFTVCDNELLELRPLVPEAASKITFKINHAENEMITLTRVRIGIKGVQELEMPLSLTKTG